MKKMKRIIALALAMVMVLAMSVPVFADPSSGEEGGIEEPDDQNSGSTNTTPSSADTGTITVYGVEAGAIVTAYKYVEAKYTTYTDADGKEKSYGFAGYQLVEEVRQAISPKSETSSDTTNGTSSDTTNGNTSGTPSDTTSTTPSTPSSDNTSTPTSETPGTNKSESTATPQYTLSSDVITNPTKDDIVTLSLMAKNNVLGNGETLTPTTDNEGNIEYYSKSGLSAGSYLILVTGTNMGYIYNPMIASISYATDNSASGSQTTLKNGTVNDQNTNYFMEGNNKVYAKSSKPTVSIEADKNDASLGEPVKFTITTTIPDYSKAYQNNDNFTYTITDTIASGFVIDTNTWKVTATYGTKTITLNQNDDNKVTMEEDTSISRNSSYHSAKGYTIDLANIAKQYPNYTITMTYTASLGNIDDYLYMYDVRSNQGTDLLNSYDNEVELKFSADLTSEENLYNKYKDTTYTYTFRIHDYQELLKVDSTFDETKGEEPTTDQLLQGAEFKVQRLVNDKVSEEGWATIKAESDQNGNIYMEGLGSGTYSMVETKAPTGYTLDGITHTLTITPTYQTATGKGKDRLWNLQITLDDKDMVKLDNTGAWSGVNTLYIKNTKLATLPTTGGIGTTIFTIAGCLIMIAAASLYFANRRKNTK